MLGTGAVPPHVKFNLLLSTPLITHLQTYDSLSILEAEDSVSILHVIRLLWSENGTSMSSSLYILSF
jgi:hypothetical protein